jgi:hypothetical protein
MKELIILDLSDNKLTTLPKSIGNLRNLDELRLDGNRLVSLPDSFKNVPAGIVITYEGVRMSKDEFMKLFKKKHRTAPVRINVSTNVFNGDINNVRLSTIPNNRRAFINKPSNVRNNGTLRRVYNVDGLVRSLTGKTSARLHGGTFTRGNITLLKNVPHTVNKSAYLRNIRNRLSNTNLNNVGATVSAIKNKLPSNVTRTDVNQVVRNMKNTLLNKVSNRLKNTPANKRNRLLNTLKSKGLINNSDMKRFKE